LWTAVVAILLDAVLTYIGVAYFGAREAVITFVNRNPTLMWPFALIQVLGALYLYMMSKKHPWTRYLLYIAAFMHIVAVANNALLLWRP